MVRNHVNFIFMKNWILVLAAEDPRLNWKRSCYRYSRCLTRRWSTFVPEFLGIQLLRYDFELECLCKRNCNWCFLRLGISGWNLFHLLNSCRCGFAISLSWWDAYLLIDCWGLMNLVIWYLILLAEFGGPRLKSYFKCCCP